MLVTLLVAVLGLALPFTVDQVANGKLQIHFMDVGQGDGTVLISPLGQTMLFDSGVRNACDKPISYLQQLGVTSVDYHVASHYHDDHIGCAKEVLDEFPLTLFAFDRGGGYNSATFRKYETKVDTKRRTAVVGQRVTLDAASGHPVQIEFAALNGAGVSTENENDLSLVAVVRFGSFDAEIGGDLSGFKEADYEDIETPVAPTIGQVEVYKVHHHGSRYSSNRTWLDVVRPKVGIISAGDNNKHGHPTTEAIERLHTKGVTLYWTSEGGGVAPEPGLDVVGRNIIVEVSPGAKTFTVRHTAGSQVINQYSMWDGTSSSAATGASSFAWSMKSNLYHHVSCRFVANISPENLVRATTPPAGKTLHMGCPK